MLKSIALQAVRHGARLPENISRFAELGSLKQLLELQAVDCVLDVGANIGQFAHDLRGLGYRGRIVSFEPLQREFSLMRESFKHDELWSGQQTALGRDNTTATFHVSGLSVLSSFHELTSKRKDMRTETVQLKRLDDLNIIKDGERVFLKMDTQGHDLEVFAGATNTLRHVVGLQSEVSANPIYKGIPSYLEAISAYESAGFKLYDLSVESRNTRGAIAEMNCRMIRN
jgi:FkbM family methyltransferase